MHFIKVSHHQCSDKPLVLSECEFVNYLIGLSSVCRFELSICPLESEDFGSPDINCIVFKRD